MADNWMEDDGWLSEAEERRKPDPNRGQILPYYKAEDGLELAWPQWMLDAYNAVTLPKDVIEGYDPTVSDTTNFALGVGGGGVTASSIVKPDADLGMFLGTRAKGADLEKYARAQELTAAGADRDQIWKETGWWQKPDGDWAWEISDDKFGFAPDIEETLNNPQPVSDPASAGNGWESINNTPEGDIAKVLTADVKGALVHDKLHENYKIPDINGTPTNFSRMTQEEVDEIFNTAPLPIKMLDLEVGATYGGSADVVNGRLKAKGRDLEETKSVALHEIQHFIQDIEGWKGRGSNPEWTAYMRNKVEKSAPPEYHNLKAYNNRLNDALGNELKVLNIIGRLENELATNFENKSLMSKWWPSAKKEAEKKRVESDLEAWKSSLDQVQKVVETLAEKIAPLLDHPEVKKFSDTIKAYEQQFGKDDFDVYRRNEGEMIAGLTQARRNMTEKERIAIPPWENFDTTFAASDKMAKDLPPEGDAWTDVDYNRFLEDYIKNSDGNLEDFNKRLKEAMNGRK